MDTNTTQTSVQSLNIDGLNCGGDLIISGIDFDNTTTSTSVASSNVQQSATEDATMAQTMTQSAEQVAKGMSFGSTSQSTSQYITETMQASQYTKSVASTECSVSQANEQSLNVINTDASGNCSITDTAFSNNQDSVNQCTQVAVQTSSQSLDLSQTGTQTSSQTAIGTSMLAILIAIMVTCFILLFMFKGVAATIYRTIIPWVLIGLGVSAILWGSGYDLAYKYPEAKSDVDVSYLNDNDSDILDCSTDYSEMEASRVSLSPPLTYWFVTHQTPVYQLMSNNLSASDTIVRIHSNRTMSTAYTPDKSGLCSSETGITKYTSPFWGSGVQTTVGSVTESCQPAFSGCSDFSNAGNGLRYIYTSYDFGGDEYVRCGKDPGNSTSDADVSKCTNAAGAAGVINHADSSDGGDNYGRRYETGTYTGRSAYKNVFSTAAHNMAECNNWANANGTGLLQKIEFGSNGDQIGVSTVQSTLLRAIPWFEHHVTNDSNATTNFNVAVFVAPYGSDASCDSVWDDLGFAPNTCQPHFWAILCFRVAYEDTLDKCLLQLGGSDGATPDAVTSCENGDCDDYKNTIAKTNWWGSEMSGMYSNTGPKVIQQNAGYAVAGHGGAGSVGGQLVRGFGISQEMGGYFLPRCHSSVPSSADGCNIDPNTALSGKTDNVCCRPAACGFDRWAEDFYTIDSNKNWQITGPIGKLNPACYAQGSILCTSDDDICGKDDTGPLPLCKDVIPFGADNEDLNSMVRFDVAGTFSEDSSGDCTASKYNSGDYIFSKSSSGNYRASKTGADLSTDDPMIKAICETGYIDTSLVTNTCVTNTPAAADETPNCYTGYSTSSDISSMDTSSYDTDTGLPGIPQNYYSAALALVGEDTDDDSTVVVENKSQRCATSNMIGNVSDYTPGEDFIPLFNICGLSGIPGIDDSAQEWACDTDSGGGYAYDDAKYGNVTSFAEAANRMCGGDYELGWGLAPNAYPFIGQTGVSKQPWKGYNTPGSTDYTKEVPLFAKNSDGAITSLWAVCRCAPPCDQDKGETESAVNVSAMMIPTMVIAWQSTVTATSALDDGGSDSATQNRGAQWFLTMGIAMITIGLVMSGFGSYILYDNSRNLNQGAAAKN